MSWPGQALRYGVTLLVCGFIGSVTGGKFASAEATEILRRSRWTNRGETP